MSAALLGPAAVPVARVEHCMGTVFSIRVCAPGVDPRVVDEAIGWLHAMDAMFSTYRADSEISRLDAGRLSLRDASAEVRFVLAECERLRAETDGYFDARAAGERLDPSGYVKGWAIQRASDMLAAAGSVNHCVNGGGDVACAGRPVSGRGWRVGVIDPFDGQTLLTTVEGTGPLAVATSGFAERGAHIIDPHAGAATTDVASITVVATDLVDADVCATAAAAMGPGRAPAWLAAHGLRALLVEPSGRQHRVGDWPATS